MECIIREARSMFGPDSIFDHGPDRFNCVPKYDALVIACALFA